MWNDKMTRLTFNLKTIRKIVFNEEDEMIMMIFNDAMIKKRYDICRFLISKYLKHNLGAIVMSILNNDIKTYKMLYKNMNSLRIELYYRTLFILSLAQNASKITRSLVKLKKWETEGNGKSAPYKTLILPKKGIKICLYSEDHLYNVEKISGVSKYIYEIVNLVSSRFLSKNLSKLSSYSFISSEVGMSKND